MVSLLWSVNGIHSVLDVPKGTIYNAALCTDAVMPSLSENVRVWTRRKTLNAWLIHMNNVCPHDSERAQSVSRPQNPSACRIRVAAKTWPRVTSSSFDISNEKYLITIMKAGRTF
jgi:hypothetical protein